MRVTKTMIMREIAGEHILIPVGEAATELFGLISLNESGALLWEKLQQECTEKDLIEAVLAEYEVDEETAGAGVRRFLKKLREENLL